MASSRKLQRDDVWSSNMCGRASGPDRNESRLEQERVVSPAAVLERLPPLKQGVDIGGFRSAVEYGDYGYGLRQHFVVDQKWMS